MYLAHPRSYQIALWDAARMDTGRKRGKKSWNKRCLKILKKQKSPKLFAQNEITPEANSNTEDCHQTISWGRLEVLNGSVGNPKAYIAAASTQTFCLGRTILLVCILDSAHEIQPQPAESFSPVQSQGNGFTHKTDAHKAFLDAALALPEGNLVFFTGRL